MSLYKIQFLCFLLVLHTEPHNLKILTKKTNWKFNMEVE